MAEWLYEAGIGEARAALIEHGVILQARIEPDDSGPSVGTIAKTRLIEITVRGRQGIVALDGSAEALLDTLPGGISQGAALMVEIVREAIPERGRAKRARAIPAPIDAQPRTGPDLLARITATGIPVRRLLAHQPDDLEAAGWSEVLDEAMTGEIAFTGGALRLSPTPAMTLFDVDGQPPLEPLAIAAAEAAALAIVRHGIGGSIGVDFPTLAGRAARQAIDSAIDATLPLPFERTATNGFGFLQIVRPRARASLPELVRTDPAAAAARAALRVIERTPPPAPRKHCLRPDVVAKLRTRPDWLAELARRTGVDATFTDATDRR